MYYASLIKIRQGQICWPVNDFDQDDLEQQLFIDQPTIVIEIISTNYHSLAANPSHDWTYLESAMGEIDQGKAPQSQYFLRSGSKEHQE